MQYRFFWKNIYSGYLPAIYTKAVCRDLCNLETFNYIRSIINANEIFNLPCSPWQNIMCFINHCLLWLCFDYICFDYALSTDFYVSLCLLRLCYFRILNTYGRIFYQWFSRSLVAVEMVDGWQDCGSTWEVGQCLLWQSLVRNKVGASTEIYFDECEVSYFIDFLLIVNINQIRFMHFRLSNNHVKGQFSLLLFRLIFPEGTPIFCWILMFKC